MKKILLLIFVCIFSFSSCDNNESEDIFNIFGLWYNNTISVIFNEKEYKDKSGYTYYMCDVYVPKYESTYGIYEKDRYGFYYIVEGNGYINIWSNRKEHYAHGMINDNNTITFSLDGTEYILKR